MFSIERLRIFEPLNHVRNFLGEWQRGIHLNRAILQEEFLLPFAYCIGHQPRYVEHARRRILVLSCLGAAFSERAVKVCDDMKTLQSSRLYSFYFLPELFRIS